MASLRDHATQGTLTQAEIDRETASRPDAVNDPDDNGLTPLLLACSKGHLDAVTLLIAAGADVNHRDKKQCTALNLAARTASPDQAAIIRALLRTDKVDVDATCPHLKGNTPLMTVIKQTGDIDSITELVNHGASVTTKNDFGQTAQDLAEELGDPQVIAALKPKSDKKHLFTRAIAHIIKTVQRVLFILNKPLKSGVRLLSSWFGYTPPEIGNQSQSQPRNRPEQRQQPDKGAVADPDKPQEPEGDETPEDREEKRILNELANIRNHIEKSGMNKFTGLDDNFLKTLTTKTEKLRNDANTDLGKPANLPDMINLAMYQPVIYCDDSGSMEGTRYSDQAEVVKRIARVTTKIIPDDMGVELRFINNTNQSSNCREETILEVIKKVKPKKSTPLGENLRKKILEPLIYKPIQRKETLQRPYLISIITDGCPDNLKAFNQAIKECKKELDQAEYPNFAVIFLISQVGDAEEAKGFLEGLQKDPVLKTMTHCTTTSLDSKFRGPKKNERELEVWLLKTLVEPIYRWGPDFTRSSSEEDKKTV